MDGAGVDLHFKQDEKLFCRYIRNAQVKMLKSVCLQMLLHSWLLLTISIQKTKHMVVGRQEDESEREPIAVEKERYNV